MLDIAEEEETFWTVKETVAEDPAGLTRVKPPEVKPCTVYSVLLQSKGTEFTLGTEPV
jgi:hypothetical protein